MTFDIAHILVTGVIVYVVLWTVNQMEMFANASKGRRTFLIFLVIFIPLFILNLVWPYGAGL